MKKKVILRIIGIGLFHLLLYLYIVPFVIYPRFGDDGFKFAVVVAILVSIAILGTMFCKEKIQGEKNE